MYDESNSNNIQKNKRLLQTPSNPPILIRKSRELGWIWASSCRHTQQLLCKGFPCWILSLESIVFSCFFSLPIRDVEPSTHDLRENGDVAKDKGQSIPMLCVLRFSPQWSKLRAADFIRDEPSVCYLVCIVFWAPHQFCTHLRAGGRWPQSKGKSNWPTDS